MSEKKIYRDYFDIDPKYYAAVTADLIKQGKVSWKSFYPHETFVKLLEKTHTVLSGKDPRSLWVEGAYGTGKSHAALTVKSLLEATDEEVETYFDEYGLSKDLCQKLITDKNSGKLITIHRIGSGSIRSDQDLILAVQDSIMAALREHKIENHGEASLKDAALKWLEKKANRDYLDNLISEEQYAWNFGGEHIDTIIERLKTGPDVQVAKTMRDIIAVAEDNGITALRLDVQGMAEWIKNIIAENDISAILFIWDEFTEFFQNNPNSLTGFQTLAEISLSHPFYFMIVSHESRSLFMNSDTAKKILDRFVPPVKIELPENMAFRLMAQAMRKTSDPVLANEWENKYFPDLNDELIDVRNIITSSAKKHTTMGQKTVISDEELQNIVPIHPYAALLLKHLSVAFNSNQRSMFDFIISNDMTDAKGFKWFINHYGPLDNTNLLTIDMLWDFFYGKGQNGLNDDVRVILDSYGLLQSDKLSPDEQRVFKTVLLFQAISMRVNDVGLLRPNEQNVDLAFSGTDWPKGKGRSIADKLCRDGLLFKMPVGGGKTEYTVANSTGDTAAIEKRKQDVRHETTTQALIVNAELLTAIQLPAAIRNRFILEGCALGNFTQITGKFANHSCPEHFKVVVTFALDDREAAQIKGQILKYLSNGRSNLIFIDTGLTPMGQDLYEQYVENMAYSRYYAQNDKGRATEFETRAVRCLNDWKAKIASGAFMVYAPEQKSGLRLANLEALQEELCDMNHQKYYYGLEQFNVNDYMFMKGPVALGAECGITGKLRQAFKSANEKTSLATALAGSWGVENYWEDQTKKSLPIVRIKQEVIRVVKEEFAKSAARISIITIYEALEKEPFGFLPCNLTAFVMGFVLKEYATSDYFWSNGSSCETMTTDKMKTMIANAINQKVSYNKNYKEEYIVTMSPEQRAFLNCTSKAFRISADQCGSIESARDQIRIKMKGLTFPIWCIKYILGARQLDSPVDKIKLVIDSYCGIANTANSHKATESDLAETIGQTVLDMPNIVSDLEMLLTNEQCHNGMLAYIDVYQGGILRQLANKIGDNGAYLDQVKQKFNVDAANWVWNSNTADEKISDVILEYKIIDESNKSLPKCTSLHEAIIEWNKRTNNIRIPYEEANKVVGDLGPLLQQLYYMKQSGSLQEQNKQKFYDALVAQRENFEQFYRNQVVYFKRVARPFLDEMNDEDITTLYADFPAGQFMKSSTEYYKYVENIIKQYIQSQSKKQLKDLWLAKTGTKDPADWSLKYETPILCMFNDSERSEAKSMFAILLDSAPSEGNVKKAIDWLSRATFYDKLADTDERDKCFMKRVVGEFTVMIKNADTARKELTDHIYDRPYDWIDNQTVQNQLRKYADKQYKLSGCERALSVIDTMEPSELRRYLRELISGSLTVGMEILKNE